MKTDEQYLLTCLLKGMMEDKNYALTIASVFQEKFFDTAPMAEIFKFVSSHVREHNALPNKDLVINSVPKNIKDDVTLLYREAESTDFNVSKNYDWLLHNTNEYLKDRAIKRAIVESVNLIDAKENIHQIRSLIEEALCRDIRVNLGLNYFKDMLERLTRIFDTSENRVKTYFPTLDELFNGGYPPYSLNMFIAATHGHKSSLMVNIASRQLLNGKNVAIATLEMSEDMYAQRFDACLTGHDINRIYINKSIKESFIKDLKSIITKSERGNLLIKEYPTGKATIADFRIWLRELSMRDLLPDIFYCDYIGLMKPESNRVGNLYEDNKIISEELRALGLEFNIPIVTVSQINRAGTFLEFEALDMNSIADSFGISATADSMVVMGKDEDAMIYQNEIRWKIVKNRLGGRTGSLGKFYHDAKSLRIYDESELDKWVEDAKKSNDTREVHNREEG